MTVNNDGPGVVLVVVRYVDRGIPATDEVLVDPTDPSLRLRHAFVTEVSVKLQSGGEASGSVSLS